MKKKGVAFVLAFFFGMFGVHRFYLGQRKLGLLYILGFFLGVLHISIEPYTDFPLFLIPALIGFIDSILFLAMPKAEFDHKFNGGQLAVATSGRSGRRRVKNKYTQAKSTSYKQNGIEKYRDYDYDGAIDDFKNALQQQFEDVAVHFNLACCYSILEEPGNALFHLEKAVEFGFTDFDRILNHDALAYLRTTDQFEDFIANNYKTVTQEETTLEPEAPSPLMDSDILEKIASLGELRDKGFLTEEEFSAQKKRLLELR